MLEYHEINRPRHYVQGRQYEPIDVLQQYFPNNPLLWQVGKYLSRYGRKSNGVNDLHKALFYLREYEASFSYSWHAAPDFNTDEVVADWFPEGGYIASATGWLLNAAGSKYVGDHLDCLKMVNLLINSEISTQVPVDSSTKVSESNVKQPVALTFVEYQVGAASTIVFPDAAKLYYPALGLCGEAGEVAEKVKKLFRDHDGVVTPEFVSSLTKELGDVLWYITALCRDLGISLEDVASGNLEKLADRHKRNVLRGNGDDR